MRLLNDFHGVNYFVHEFVDWLARFEYHEHELGFTAVNFFTDVQVLLVVSLESHSFDLAEIYFEMLTARPVPPKNQTLHITVNFENVFRVQHIDVWSEMLRYKIINDCLFFFKGIYSLWAKYKQ